MNKENAIIFCEALVRLAEEISDLHNELLLLCDRIETGSINEDEFRELHLDYEIGEAIKECYRRLDVVAITYDRVKHIHFLGE